MLRRLALEAASKGLPAHALALADLWLELVDEHDDEAPAVLERVLALASTEPRFELELRLALSERLNDEHHRDEAQAVLEPALERGPEPVMRIRLLTQLFRATESMAFLHETLALAGEDPAEPVRSAAVAAQLLLGQEAKFAGEPEVALAAFAQVSHWAPARLMPRIAWVDLLLDAGALEQASAVVLAAPPPKEPDAVLVLEKVRADVARRLRGPLAVVPLPEEPPALPLGPHFTRPARPSWRGVSAEALASDDRVREASHGEVRLGRALDERGRPVRSGPRCPRIFGPTGSGACECGRYAGPEHRGIVCERCGVELISSEVRATRQAHVRLASRIIHPWFLDSVSAVLGLSDKQLADVLALRQGIVTDPGLAAVEWGQLIAGPVAGAESGSGPEAIAELLGSYRLDPLRLVEEAGPGRQREAAQALLEATVSPRSFVIEVVPVPPPAARVAGVETALTQLFEANALEAELSTPQHQAALQKAVAAWFDCF